MSLRPIAQLPSTDALLLGAARDIALLSGGLMASTGSPMLALALPSDRWSMAPITLWNDRLAPCEARRRCLFDTPQFSPVLEALCLASDALFERLDAWQWRDAHEPGLCAITDGTGLLLTTRAEGIGQGPAWLLSLARRGGALPLLPFASNGIWALLQAEAEAVTCH